MATLGIGKTLFNSSACYLNENVTWPEIVLTERISRKKASGAWPEQALEYFKKKYELNNIPIGENRDVEDPAEIEQALNSQFPFFEYLKQKNLQIFSRHFNQNIHWITHHRAHAYAAQFMSPFSKSLILVIDGAGSRENAFQPHHAEFKFIPDSIDRLRAEERTAYLLDKGQLTCIDKKWQTFTKSKTHPNHHFSEGLGSFYEKISEYIFNSKRSAGKVMGLAAFSNTHHNVVNSLDYLENLNWSLQFKGQSKQSWESTPHMQTFCDVAATAQNYFEENLISYVKKLAGRYPEYRNLIITGGCALNCTTNMKLFDLKLFDEIYVPPFPGDESISLGVAVGLQPKEFLLTKPTISHDLQQGYFGPTSSVPCDDELKKVFQDYTIEQPQSITDLATELLLNGQILGWFQGRSESGPRALGHRSILARPDKKGLKNTLNTNVKFRESFRPYGCSVLHEKASLYFNVPYGFNNPFMSFAVKVNIEYRKLLAEVMHIDGTSRMQTVQNQQCPIFYELIKKFGDKSGLYCLLNTSLNIMSEPIVETIQDAKNFLDHAPVDGLIIQNFYIKKIHK